jgi:hypothetical protein
LSANQFPSPIKKNEIFPQSNYRLAHHFGFNSNFLTAPFSEINFLCVTLCLYSG